jgi:hypothetical protein
MAERHFHSKDMLRFADAIDVLGVSERTMWRRLGAKPMVEVPPFKMVGRQRRWRYDFLIAFREGKTALRGEVQDYPDQVVKIEQFTPRPIHELVQIVDNWKRRELYRRAQEIVSGSSLTPIGTVAFDEETLLFGPDSEWKDWKNTKTLMIVNPVSDYVEYLLREIGYSAGDDMSPNGHPLHLEGWQMGVLMLAACREVYAMEARGTVRNFVFGPGRLNIVRLRLG